MDQQLIVMYLSLNGLNATEIHNDLVSTLKSEAKSDGTLANYFCKPSFSSPKTSQPSESPAAILNESDEAILLALSEEPFASVRQLARRTNRRRFTSYDQLTHTLGLTVRDLCCVPHLLSEADQHNRAPFSFGLFETLQYQKNRTGHDIVIIEKYWFHFTIDHKEIGFSEGTEAPKRERITVQSKNDNDNCLAAMLCGRW
jgi:hypothetical protein